MLILTVNSTVTSEKGWSLDRALCKFNIRSKPFHLTLPNLTLELMGEWKITKQGGGEYMWSLWRQQKRHEQTKGNQEKETGTQCGGRKLFRLARAWNPSTSPTQGILRNEWKKRRFPAIKKKPDSNQWRATVFPISRVQRLGDLGDLFRQRAKLAPEFWLLRFSACRLGAHPQRSVLTSLQAFPGDSTDSPIYLLFLLIWWKSEDLGLGSLELDGMSMADKPLISRIAKGLMQCVTCETLRTWSWMMQLEEQEA